MIVAFLTTALALAGPTTADLAFLEGAWTGTVDGQRFDSLYTNADGGVVLSTSKFFGGEEVVFFEVERFQVTDGTLTFYPYPGGKQSKHAFPCVDLVPDKATFRNDANDFPKQLVYQRVAPDHLVITLTGEVKGEPVETVFDLRRGP